MTEHIIAKHFLAVLGTDVGVTVGDGSDSRTVVLYRPDRLSEDFVALAFQALEDEHPAAAAAVDRVLVAFDGPLGRSRVRVDVRPAAVLPADAA